MGRTFRWSALLLVAAMLSGCGAQALAPAPLPAREGLMARNSPTPEGLIAAYRAVPSEAPEAVARRLSLLAQLGETDSDAALEFLLAEMARLDGFEEPARTRMASGMIAAIVALDNYDPVIDEAVLAAGPEGSAVAEAAYAEAQAAKKRRKRIETNPFKMLWKDLQKLWRALTGKPKKKKRKPRPAPAPAPDPAPAPEPAA